MLNAECKLPQEILRLNAKEISFTIFWHHIINQLFFKIFKVHIVKITAIYSFCTEIMISIIHSKWIK